MTLLDSATVVKKIGGLQDERAVYSFKLQLLLKTENSGINFGRWRFGGMIKHDGLLF